jgi:hypothetical protein
MESQDQSDFNAGAILFDLLCSSIEIRNWRKMDVDDKNKLLSFLNNQIDYYEFTLDTLNRIIRRIISGKHKDKVSSTEPTLCDLCYIALNIKQPGLKVLTRTYKGNIHAKYVHADDFNKYINKAKPVFDKSLVSKSSTRFPISNWYIYINVYNKETGVRSIGRRVLKFIQDAEEVKIEYFISDMNSSDWRGHIPATLDGDIVVFHLKTTQNNDRYLDIWLRIGNGKVPPIIHGELCFPTIDGTEICHPPIVMIEVDQSQEVFPSIINENTDESIKEIDDYLKRNANKIVINKIPLHNCGNELDKH